MSENKILYKYIILEKIDGVWEDNFHSDVEYSKTFKTLIAAEKAGKKEIKRRADEPRYPDCRYYEEKLKCRKLTKQELKDNA